MTAEVVNRRELLHIQLRTAFLLDRHGRLLAINEPGSPAAPRVFVATSEGERVLRVRRDIPESVARAWLAAGASDDRLVEAVAAHAPIQREHRGPAYWLPPQAVRSAEGVVDVRSSRLPLHPELVARGWGRSEAAPYLGIVRDGQVVAVCYSSRDGDAACEAGVETATSYRGRTLGELAVRAWAAAVQASGRMALYSTSWDNAASRRIAAKLGAEEYGENWHLT